MRGKQLVKKEKMDKNDFKQEVGEPKVLGHISKAMEIHKKHGILSGDEISNLETIKRRIESRCRARTQAMTKMPSKEREELRRQRQEWEREQWIRDQERAGMLKHPTLFRAFKEAPEVLNNHLLGRLWFQSLRYFRKHKGARADILEGIGSHKKPCGGISQDISDKTTINPTFILCFGEQAESLQHFGDHYLEVQDPWELKRRVEMQLPDESRVRWMPIKYDKTWEVKDDLSPFEGWSRKYYSKPKEFADEKEWRLMIWLPPPFQLLNETLKINVRNLEGVFKYRGHYNKQ